MAALRAVLFDVFGTLLDVHSVARRAEELFPGRGEALSRLWREKQLEYLRIRTLSGHYLPFSQVSEDALHYAGEQLGLALDRAAAGALLHEYTLLEPFADALPALQRLRAADATLGVLSNGDPGLLDEALSNAGLGECFDLVLSADAVRAYKTAPAVYELGPRSLGHPAAQTLFVSGNGWDAVGAQWYGYAGFWVNRNDAPAERLHLQTAAGATLADAADFYLAARG